MKLIKNKGNDRVLVFVPRRLCDNGSIYKSNDRCNSLSADRLHYDVLNHPDLSHINWGNDELVIIDESHDAATNTNSSLTRYTWYKAFVVAGAREHKLRSEYIRPLEAVQATDEPNDERHDKNIRLLMGTGRDS